MATTVKLHEPKENKKIQMLSEAYIEEHLDELDIDEISLYQNLSLKFLMRHQDKINWKLYSINSNITLDAIEFFTDKISWVNFCINGKLLNPAVIYNYRDYMIWNIVLNKQQLEPQLLIILSELYRKNPNNEHEKSFWKAISRYQDFDIEYAAEYAQYIDWEVASSNTLLNELVLQGFMKQMNMGTIMKTRKLSNDFLYKNKDYIKKILGIE